MQRDPNGASPPGSGIYGLSTPVAEARVVVVPVPFDATASYRKGAAKGPATVLAASKQVELLDTETGNPWRDGIAMAAWPAATGRALVRMNREATRLADPVIAAAGPGRNRALQRRAQAVDAIGSRVNAIVRDGVRALLAQGKLVALLGGDHSTPFGSIEAHAEAHPGMGILHVDAHPDLRERFEGFTWSHASILYNVATRIPAVSRIVQVGVRDISPEELERARDSRGRIRQFLDADMARERFQGVTWDAQCRRIAKALPRDVYVSFDIDGLDPKLCPHTGTPVPGGLSFQEASQLLRAVVESGRRIVGVDLNEVAPGPDGDEWDGNVGARVLYRLIGWMVASQARPAGRGRR